MVLSIASSAVPSNSSTLAPEPHGAVEISLARTTDDLMGAFRLLYLSYVRAGLDRENPHQLRLTPYHPLPTTEVFVAKCRGEVVSTMTMVGDGALGLPMQSMYGEELGRFSRSGLRLAEMGCFADRRTSPARFKEVFNELVRLAVQVARARGIDGFVAATHPRHARFYIRWLNFVEIGELKQCPYAAGNPAVALLLDFDAIRGTAVHERLFGQPVAPESLHRTRSDQETIGLLQQLAQSVDHSPSLAASH